MPAANSGINSLDDLVKSLGMISSQTAPEPLKLMQLIDVTKQSTNDPRTDALMQIMQTKAMSSLNDISAPDHSSDVTKADSLTSSIMHPAGSGSAIDTGIPVPNVTVNQQSGGGGDGIGGLISAGVSIVSSLCFITTAVCNESNKPDNCEELTEFRRFRDTYMQETPERQQLVLDYYKKAPLIVSRIDSLSPTLRAAVYHYIDSHYIQPAVTLMKSRKYDEAFEIYYKMYSTLSVGF